MVLNKPYLRSFLLIWLCFVAAAAAVHAYPLEKGVLLVANEQLRDPRFRDGVILLIQHDDQGSAGLVVNRESRLSLASILPEDSILAGDGAKLSYGGPVDTKTLFALVKVREHPPEPADEVIDGLYVTGVGVLDEWPDFVDEVVDYRVFVGYTGWAAGQLGQEIQRGDWHVLPADEESVLGGEKE